MTEPTRGLRAAAGDCELGSCTAVGFVFTGTLPAMSPRVASRRWSLAVRLAVAALVWSAGLALAALLVPAYGSNASSEPGGLTITSSTLVQSKGAWAFTLITIPAIVSIVVGTAMVRRRRDGGRWSLPVAWTAIGLPDSRLPVLIYHDLELAGDAGRAEQAFAAIDWTGVWRNGNLAEYEAVRANIAAVPRPEADPVYGPDGPLSRLSRPEGDGALARTRA